MLTVAVVAVSFITAGQLIQRQHLVDVHGYAAIALHVSSGVLALALIGLAQSTRRGWGAAILAVVLFAYTFLQAYLGEGRTLYLHIPGALLVAGASVWLTAWLFTSRDVAHNGP
jgi:apolipoprotein N-acyltransferase